MSNDGLPKRPKDPDDNSGSEEGWGVAEGWGEDSGFKQGSGEDSRSKEHCWSCEPGPLEISYVGGRPHRPHCGRGIEKGPEGPEGPEGPARDEVLEAMRSMQSPNFLRERKLREIDEKLLDAPIGRSTRLALGELLFWLADERGKATDLAGSAGENGRTDSEAFFSGVATAHNEVMGRLGAILHAGVEEERERWEEQLDWERLGNWTTRSEPPGVPVISPLVEKLSREAGWRGHGPGGGDSVRGEGDEEEQNDDPGESGLEGI